MQCRLWFWTADNPRPRVIAHGSGPSLWAAMVECFAPFHEPGWAISKTEDGDIYLRRGNRAGYCGQEVVEGEPARVPRTGIRLALDRPRKRERLSL